MYVTRPLSLYKNSPDSISEPPPEGPNSGYLVIQDEESMTPSCFGFSTSLSVKDMPLPSNKILKIDYTDVENEIFAIPVIDMPLSSNRYYMIKAHGKNKGEAYSCSKEEDKGVSCGRSYIQDEKLRPLNPDDIYQQYKFEFSETVTCTTSKGFLAKSTAPDGHPPKFLRTKSVSPLQIRRSAADLLQGKATGINSSLRAQFPDFDFPLSREFSPTVVCVGKWYSPFMFIHEGKLEDQVKNSVYYEITLEQRWERIFAHDSSYSQGNTVIIDVVLPTQVVTINGKNAFQDESKSDTNVVWFRTVGRMGEEISVGLSSLIVERMIWEEERVGWVDRNGKQVRVVREEEYGGIGWWARFGCYVLVERFVVKRMDGSLVLTYDFKHTHHINTKWE